MASNEELITQLGDQLDKLALGGSLTREFSVFRNLFGKADDAATEEAAKEFAKRHYCTFRYCVEQGLGIFERVPIPGTTKKRLK